MESGLWERMCEVWGVGVWGDGMVGNAKGGVRKEQHTL